MVERSCTVYSIEYKMSAVKAYLESGEPIKQFCRENNIKYQTFYGWCWIVYKIKKEFAN